MPTIPKEFLKAPDQPGPHDPPKRGKAERQHPDRRILIVLRQRGKTKGKGASATRIGIAITESGAAVTSMATQYASAESVIMSDEDTSYSGFKDYQRAMALLDGDGLGDKIDGTAGLLTL